MSLKIRTLASFSMLALAILPAAADGNGPARERDTYRPAGTYATLRGSTPDACAATCESDAQCRAWSLTPPTFRAGPKCELKSVDGPPVERVAAISGIVKRSSAPVSVAYTPPPPSQPQAAEARPPVAQPAAPRPAPTGSIQQQRMDEPDRRPLPAQPASIGDADRPWPGLRRSEESGTYTLPPEGTRPLPRRRQDGIPVYSVQHLETLPADYKDNAGLQGRLPSGQLPEEAETEDSEN
ncbi:hypothetical protein D1227_12555 [Henriciella mobilis]|uniref:PAN/Apple domain-containing protein n=1 Tax=Henriciella mobilis TaxID=2305467 RepID=UPI000E662B99|nr:PAN/Apple domain-containing protein [Henriciella mobilis]RIJ15924.1 hypothetical protein D1231_09015 [Henriciella mobilis]RIJ21134.1 hypothetical protein D1227_12555 [Henriciella mobilis]